MHNTKDFINKHARVMIFFLAFNSCLLTGMAFIGFMANAGEFGGAYVDLFIHSVVALIIVRHADIKADTFGPAVIFHLSNTAMIITLILISVRSGFGYVVPAEIPLIGGAPGLLCAFLVAVPAITAQKQLEKKVRAFVANQNDKEQPNRKTSIEL